MIFFILNLAIFIVLLASIAKVGKNQWSLALRTFFGLFLGILFGVLLQFFYGHNSDILKQTIEWFNIVGNGYVLLLQMIVMPLVFASILSAVSRLHSASSLGKIATLTIGTLLITTAIAALVGILMVLLFHLNAQGLITDVDTSLMAAYETKRNAVSDMSIPQVILSFIPKNPFADLTGARPTSIISVVIFASFLGGAAIMLLKSNKEKGEAVLSAIDTLQLWIMKLVRIVILLTPYGVFALMIKMSATSNSESIIQFATFIIASYLAMAIMFFIHGLLLSLTGINPFKFYKKVFPVLTFAFTSRSSAASIPLNIEAQVSRIGVPQSIASFSASFGTTIGQNGCAGIYPAMLAAMMAPTVGINPLDPAWIMLLVAIVTLSSIGVAGVGGGATFAALIVLPTMGLPITLVPLLIAIEPLIDMGRTALNVNGSMTAGTITSQIMKQTDMTIFNNNDDADLKQV